MAQSAEDALRGACRGLRNVCIDDIAEMIRDNPGVPAERMGELVRRLTYLSRNFGIGTREITEHPILLTAPLDRTIIPRLEYATGGRAKERSFARKAASVEDIREHAHTLIELDDKGYIDFLLEKGWAGSSKQQLGKLFYNYRLFRKVMEDRLARQTHTLPSPLEALRQG